MRNLNFKLMSLVFLLCTISFISNAKAASQVTTKCTYVSSEAAQGLFSAMPSALIGAATCNAEYKDLSSFLILKMKTLDEKSLNAAVAQVAQINHPMNESATVTWKSNQPLESRQMMVTTTVAKTDHSNAQVMLHYAFVAKATDGAYLVFVHSAPEHETHALRQALEATNRELRSPAFLEKIAG